MKYGDFLKGQSNLGKLDQGKMTSLDNIDIHTNPGMAQPQLAMESESTTPKEKCVNAIDPEGNVYFCSTESGKIWKRTTAGVYSLVHTNGNGSHRGCQYFNGYLWYWTNDDLGHFDLSSTWTDSFATFVNGNARGSVEANNTLLIGDGKYVTRIDSANTFSANEFVIPAQYNITEMVNIGDDVLIGTYVSEDVAYCKAFLWDTVSSSWTYEDEVFEIGINSFVQLDNVYIAQCGTSGKFYYWTGARFNYFGRIRGITTKAGEVGNKGTVFNGVALYANGTKIYSIHKEDPSLNFAFCGEYTCTGTINSLAVQGQTLLASVGTGVDKRGDSYAIGTVITPERQGKVSKINVAYDEYPEGIGIETKVQNGSWTSQTAINENNGRYAYFDGGLEDNSVCQVKITLTPNGSDIPKIKQINLNK